MRWARLTDASVTQECIRQPLERFALRLLPPARRDPIDAVLHAGNLAVDRAGRVRVVAEIDRQQRAVLERGALRERPQRRFERGT